MLIIYSKNNNFIEGTCMSIEELGDIISFFFFVKVSRSTDTMLLTGIVLMFYVPD